MGELRNACRARGLPASGGRSELVGRLAALAPQALKPHFNSEILGDKPLGNVK